MRRTQLLCNSWVWSKNDSNSTLEPNLGSKLQDLDIKVWEELIESISWTEHGLKRNSPPSPSTCQWPPCACPSHHALKATSSLLLDSSQVILIWNLVICITHKIIHVLKDLVSYNFQSLKTAEECCRISDVCLFDLNTAWSFGFQVKHLFNHHSNTTPPSCSFTGNNGTQAETEIQIYNLLVRFWDQLQTPHRC